MSSRYNQSVLAELIERARRNRGMTQSELARAAGVGQQAVGKWEAGLTRPRPDAIPAVATALGVAASVLLVEAGYLDGDKPDPLSVHQELEGDSIATITIDRDSDSLFDRPRAEALPSDPDELRGAAASGIDVSDLTPDERAKVQGYIDALRERRSGR